MMRAKFFIFLFFYFFIFLFSRAQQPWTLRQCADYAVSHNIAVRQSENQLRQDEVQVSTARWQRLPDLNASAGESFSFGRGLTLDNTYANRSTSSTSFSVGTSVPLFTGFRIPNQIRQSQLNLEAATRDLEKARNDIRMQVAQAYVQVLYDMELADVARRQIAIDSQQVVRLRAFVDNGRASQAEFSQQEATLAQSRLTATRADNSRQLSLLALSQLLELPSPDGFTIARPALTAASLAEPSAEATDASLPAFDLSSHPLPSPDVIYQEALGVKPEIAAEQLRLVASERSIDIARSARYPQLSLSAGLQSNYYKTNGMPADGFMTQLKNNFSQYVGLNLSVPVFNRFATRNSIRTAQLAREAQQLRLDQAKKALYKEVQQVYYNAVAARSRYASSEAALSSSRQAFRLMQAKYENGKATITEFNEMKNNLLKTESDLLQARYEYLYQTALVDFYRGRELSF